MTPYYEFVSFIVFFILFYEKFKYIVNKNGNLTNLNMSVSQKKQKKMQIDDFLQFLFKRDILWSDFLLNYFNPLAGLKTTTLIFK